MGNEYRYNRIEKFLTGDSTELTGENIDLLLDNPDQTEPALKKIRNNTHATFLQACDYVVREEILKMIKKGETNNPNICL